MATLGLFIVGVFSLLFFDPIQTAYFHNEPSIVWKLVNLVTHMVSHGNWAHLTGNFIFGAPFMIYLEHRLKCTKTFVRLFFALGLGALGTQILVNQIAAFPSMALIGSSGAIFGLVAAALCMYDGPKLLKLAARALVTYHAVTQLQMTLFSLLIPLGVAYGAHFGGIVFGILFTYLHHRRHRRRCRSRAK